MKAVTVVILAKLLININSLLPCKCLEQDESDWVEAVNGWMQLVVSSQLGQKTQRWCSEGDVQIFIWTACGVK